MIILFFRLYIQYNKPFQLNCLAQQSQNKQKNLIKLLWVGSIDYLSNILLDQNINFVYFFIIDMAKSLTIQQYSALTGELDMLRDYTKVLEAENRSRDQERKILEKQIQRLNNIIVSSTKNGYGSSVQNCGECATLKSEIIKLDNQIERLKRQNTNLQSNNNVLSQNLARFNSTNTVNQSLVTNSRITVIRSTNSRQIDNSNITLGPTGSIGGVHEEDISELNNKMELLVNQNNRLKKQQQKCRQLQINVSKLNSEKQTLSIKITTLEQQIHNLKTTIFNKDNEIFNYKTKVQSQTLSTSLQTQLKTMKQSLKAKQNELTQVKQKISSFTSLQLELRNLKYTVQAKQNQIGNLKSQISRMEQETNNVYKLEGQVRNFKYQITSKDSEMQGLINKIAEIQAGEQVNLQNKDREISQLKFQISEAQNLRSQIINLQNQSRSWKAKFQEKEKQYQATTSVQTVASSISTQYGEQISYLNIQIARIKTESSDKDVYINKIEDQIKELTQRDLQKEAQVRKLDKIVNSYMEKIGELENEINKLEKSSVYSSGKNNTNIVQVVNNEEIMLLSQQNRILNQKIEDQSRRITLLEQTNLNLRQQLKHSIQIRSREASRLIIGAQQPQFPDEQLLTVIKLLKHEVEEIKNFNNILKSDNQYLQAKLSSCELEIQNLTNFGKGPNYVMGIGLKSNRTNQNSNIDPMGLNIITTNKILSSVPVTQTNKVFINQNQKQREFQREYQKQMQKRQRQRDRSRLKQGQKSKSVKKLIKQEKITVLDEKERDPVTSSVLSSISPKARFKQKEPKSSFGSKQPAEKSQASRNRLSLDQTQGNYSKLSSNLSNISPSNASNLANTINSSNMGMTGNINGSHVSSNLSGGRKGQYDDLQKRIQMLKQENKGLRKHLYEPPM